MTGNRHRETTWQDPATDYLCGFTPVYDVDAYRVWVAVCPSHWYHGIPEYLVIEVFDIPTLIGFSKSYNVHAVPLLWQIGFTVTREWFVNAGIKMLFTSWARVQTEELAEQLYLRNRAKQPEVKQRQDVRKKFNMQFYSDIDTQTRIPKSPFIKYEANIKYRF